MVAEDTTVRKGFLKSSRYSPGNMDRGSLEALFVGRQKVMDDILTRAAASIEGPQKHYLLLVGPRGSGKTHFLTLAHHRLMDHIEQAEMADRVAVALLKEEEWGVASYLDLVVRILRALADDSPGLESGIANIYASFAKDVASAERLAIELLSEHTRNKTLLLLCENLVDLLDGLGDEGQKRWRSAIQEGGNWAIVATTPQLSAALTLQKSPFFGFFTIRGLDRIDLDAGIDLLAKKAVHEDKAEVAELLYTPLGRARARAIHHLAAGNHRAYVVLFDFLDRESLDDLVGPFMRMVDDLTPYYQDRMRQLPPTQRKILEHLCVAGKPVTVKEISTGCLMSQQTAAKQIGELESGGFVSRTRSGRNTFCELSEPLMRICIEVKDNRTGHFRLFVEFLRHWFTTRELQHRRSTYQHHDAAELHLRHVDEAIRCALADRHAPLVDALHHEAKRCRVTGDYRGLAAIQKTLAREDGRADDFSTWVYALFMAGDGAQAVEAGREGLARHPDDIPLLYNLAHGYAAAGLFEEALTTINRVIDLDPDGSRNYYFKAHALLVLERFQEAIDAAEIVLKAEPDRGYGFEQIVEGLVRLGRVKEAEARVADLVKRAPEALHVLVTAARFRFFQRRFHEALELAQRALDVDDGHWPAQELRGLALFEMADYGGARDELRQLAELHPRSVHIQQPLAYALLQCGEFEEAIQVAEHLIDVNPRPDHAHFVRGCALIELDSIEEAMAAFDQLLHTTNWWMLLTAALEARQQEDFEAAARYLDRVAELAPDNLELWVERTRLAIASGTVEAAMSGAAKVGALPDGAQLGRLLTAHAIATRERPLATALATIGTVDPACFRRQAELQRSTLRAILTESLHNSGPLQFPEGLATLRHALGGLLDEGVLGSILTDFLIDNVDQLDGALQDWETALDRVDSMLSDLPDCQIPLEMLRAAVRYTTTGDEKDLLRLPLEQRELLRDVLPSTPASPKAP